MVAAEHGPREGEGGLCPAGERSRAAAQGRQSSLVADHGGGCMGRRSGPQVRRAGLIATPAAPAPRRAEGANPGTRARARTPPSAGKRGRVGRDGEGPGCGEVGRGKGGWREQECEAPHRRVWRCPDCDARNRGYGQSRGYGQIRGYGQSPGYGQSRGYGGYGQIRGCGQSRGYGQKLVSKLRCMCPVHVARCHPESGDT